MASAGDTMKNRAYNWRKLHKVCPVCLGRKPSSPLDKTRLPCPMCGKKRRKG
jgi:hypothetical protein